MRKLNKRSVNKLTQARNTFYLLPGCPKAKFRLLLNFNQCWMFSLCKLMLLKPRNKFGLLSSPEHLVRLELAIFLF